MLQTYRAVFRAPGSRAFTAAGFVMRMPIAMYPIGLVLIVSARDGRYGFAGVLSAVYTLGAVPGQPLLSRFVDRYGQRALIAPATAVHVAAVVLLAVLLQAGAPDWTLVLPSFVTGFAYLAVGSLVRARWSLVLAGLPELTTAYSLESVLDELIFVIGPVIATGIAAGADPVLVLYLGIVLVSLGASWLWMQRATEPPRQPRGAANRRSALREPGMPLLICTATAIGMIFASAEITMVAYFGQHGHRAISGLAIAFFAGGSGLAGLFYGSVTWRRELADRFRWNAVIFGALTLLFLAVPNIWLMFLAAFVVGSAIAPTLITAFGLVEQQVPSSSLTEGLSWLITGLNIGYGAGAAMVGGLADAHGARLAFLITIASGLVTAALAQALYRRLRAPRSVVAPAVAPSEHAALP